MTAPFRVVQSDDRIGGHRRGAQQGGPQGGGQLAGALEVQPGEGVLEFGKLEHLQHHVGAHQQGVHLIGIKFTPEGHQIVIGEGGGGGGLVRFRLVVVAVPVHEHVHTVGEQHPVLLGQRNRPLEWFESATSSAYRESCT